MNNSGKILTNLVHWDNRHKPRLSLANWDTVTLGEPMFSGQEIYIFYSDWGWFWTLIIEKALKMKKNTSKLQTETFTLKGKGKAIRKSYQVWMRFKSKWCGGGSKE